MVSKGLDKLSENEELKGDELSGLTVLKPNALHLHITSTQNGNLKLITRTQKLWNLWFLRVVFS